jgi:endonuclease/exonuclease/phosphatase (EEP) superfamily protein YafD
MVGDFNVTPWSPLFADLLRDSGLADSCRGFGWQPTWPTRLPAMFRIPIDHCLHGAGVAIVDRRVGPEIGSDHLPLLLELR